MTTPTDYQDADLCPICLGILSRPLYDQQPPGCPHFAHHQQHYEHTLAALATELRARTTPND